MTQARTTVVIATRDRAPELARTLRELGALRPRPPVVVVDNGSSDETPDVATRAGPGVRLIRLPGNLAAAARNVGVAAARTPYAAFSDDDSWWAPDALARAEALFDAHPRLGLIAATLLVEPGGRPDPVNRALADSPLGTADGLPGPSVLGFLACAAIVRREAFEETDGFARVLGVGGEETLLAYDLAARGWELCHVGGVRAHHRPSAVRPPGLHRRRRELRNAALTAWLRRPPGACAAAAWALVRAGLREPALLPAVGEAVRLLPWAVRRRRRLPEEVERRVRVVEKGR